METQAAHFHSGRLAHQAAGVPEGDQPAEPADAGPLQQGREPFRGRHDGAVGGCRAQLGEVARDLGRQVRHPQPADALTRDDARRR